ncbi:TetR/AcrR family transcriptional regulator [Cellulophaga baltica]|uniref:TetR/AcrR family transcriptional regulator n=1 Tax=Cellulophaga TaxID=104264 RepID=UPI001C07BF4C|nr:MULTISPECIES: TetR/AcrR family transcriptional regulator [Cellulophaga]MBU2995753.1 TetR/AcrR family transcriptional regulator [Cellulophaga baltica]MDO6767147.1 TetR/AcrR family transcriptional regulator [Cellulophaga sp. 1_MG-2023]
MINKDQFLEVAISKFTKFGCKRFTLDDLAHEMGVSKKTIYESFSTKEAIVSESLNFLLNKIDLEFINIIKEEENPILSIIKIYKIGLNYLKSFSPAYIMGLKKYYPKSYIIYSEFKVKVVQNHVKNLLEIAQEQKYIKANLNIQLFCNLYFMRLDNILFGTDNLFELYTVDNILEQLITNSLRGVCTDQFKID